MVRNQHPRGVRIGARKGFANELDLLVADAPVLERERARGVDPEHSDALELEERAKRLVNEPPVARQRREETAEHVVKRHVMIAGHAKPLVIRLAQPLEEMAGLFELLGPCALG